MEPRSSTEAPVVKSAHKTRRQKTFTGCWDCRSRKIKCDEATPECTPCRKRGFPCSGYKPVLVWVTPNDKGYESGRRRVLQSHLTWRGHRVYDSDAVDDLIAKCSIFELNDPGNNVSAGPFTVFASIANLTPSPQMPLSDMDKLFEDIHDPQARECASFLFHHYIISVASNMMPFEDRRNPWRSIYPLLARRGYIAGQKSLLYAILAQAAGHLAHIGSREEYMSTMTMKYYALAIEAMRKGLQEKEKDFSLVLATVLTLIMAEIYNGKFKAWKMHFNGGWNFISFYLNQNQTPWNASEAAWLTSQSLCLLKIRFDTMQPLSDKTNSSAIPRFDFERRIISSVAASRADFGFTTGGSSELFSYMMETTQLASKSSQMNPEEHKEATSRLYQKIQGCSYPQDYSDQSLAKLHYRIFQLGVIIYFHRSLFNSPPHAMVPYINKIFRKVKEYHKLGGGFVTLWPVFIAAVEVYTQEHKALVREWLDQCDKMGAANRKDIRELIEAVWEKRSNIYDLEGYETEQGSVILDWREIMRERQLDVLLV